MCSFIEEVVTLKASCQSAFRLQKHRLFFW